MHTESIGRYVEGAEFVENTSECPHIRLIAIPPILTDLGTEIVRSAHKRICRLLHSLQNLTDTKISNLNSAVRVEEDIAALNIPVEDFIRMDALQP